MKKLFIAVLAVAALASCAQDEVITKHNQVAIGFGNAYDPAIGARVARQDQGLGRGGGRQGQDEGREVAGADQEPD